VVVGNGVEPLELPGGRVVELVHVGSYESLRVGYDAVVEWMGRNNLTPSSVMWESYLNEPDPARLESAQTLITWPVA
jgi:effector-binding domain-containing protein